MITSKHNIYISQLYSTDRRNKERSLPQNFWWYSHRYSASK